MTWPEKMEEVEKKLLFYMKGRGIDTSRTPMLRDYSEVDVSCVFKEPNNLYHFYAGEGIEYETLDFVFNNGLLSETKYYMILMKEWFYLLRIGGNLVIRFKDSPLINRDNFKELFVNLIGDKGEILYLKKDDLNHFTVIVQKLRSVVEDNDGINRWSFCVINSTPHDLAPLIRSIESQKIKEYEILVDDASSLRDNQPNVMALKGTGDIAGVAPATQTLKNKMLFSARYENIVLIDRKSGDLVLDDNWFYEMKRYGNYFEALSPAILTADNERYADWWTLGCNKKNISERMFQRSKLGLLEYRDWDKWVYFPDPVCILKKSLYQKALWDNLSVEGDENTLFSHRLYENGVLLRTNPYLVFRIYDYSNEMLSTNFPYFEFNSTMLGQRRGKFLRRAMWSVLEMLLKIGRLDRVLLPSVRFVKSSRIYRVLNR